MHATGRALAGIALIAAGMSLVACVPSMVHRTQSSMAMKEGNLAQAEQSLTRALKADSTDWENHYQMGLLRLKQQQPSEAQFAFEKALQLRHNQPETPAILDGLAEALFQQNRPDHLAAMLQKMAYDRGTVRDYLRQAYYLSKIGDADGVKLAFRKAAKIADRIDPSPYLAAADYFESIGNSEEAILALRRAYYITPDDPQIAARLRNYGLVPGPTIALEPEKD